MANDRWTPTDEVSKLDKYEWKSPSGTTEHEEQTTGPGDLMIKPKDLTLIPTNSPKRSGLQWGQDAWNYSNAPDQTWYIFGGISD